MDLVQWKESVKINVPIKAVNFSFLLFVSFNDRYRSVYCLATGIDYRERW